MKPVEKPVAPSHHFRRVSDDDAVATTEQIEALFHHPVAARVAPESAPVPLHKQRSRATLAKDSDPSTLLGSPRVSGRALRRAMGLVSVAWIYGSVWQT